MLKCPKCNDVTLVSKSRSELPDMQFSLISCPNCEGRWVKSQELIKICDYSVEDRHVVIDANRDENLDARTGVCPEGHGLMTRAKVDLDPHFYLERCSMCGGVWFDKGELSRVIESNLAENLSVIWTFAWQRRSRQEKGRQYYLDINKKLLGNKIYDTIIRLAGMLRNHPEQLRAISLLHEELEVNTNEGGNKVSPELSD